MENATSPQPLGSWENIIRNSVALQKPLRPGSDETGASETAEERERCTCRNVGHEIELGVQYDCLRMITWNRCKLMHPVVSHLSSSLPLANNAMHSPASLKLLHTILSA